jgi:hypothetical protein
MSTATGAGLTVTPIFWAPLGRRFAFPPKYESIIDSYVSNVAAASGSTDNVYSVDTEYYDMAGGAESYIKYAIHAGGPVVDTDAFPPYNCSPAPGYTACITDLQLKAELRLITSDLRLPTNLAHFYPVFFPPGVETVDIDGSNSYDGFCGYHRAFGPNGDKTVYADIAYEATSCNAGQAPNGNLPADGAVSTLSHELNEAITDPLELQHAWTDTASNEIADLCDEVYGRPLGSTNPSNPSGSEYNQVINGGTYYTQEMFSNLAYAKYGNGKGCTLSEGLAQNPNADGLGTPASTVVSEFAGATPSVLPANGKATSTVLVTASDSLGNGVAGDHVYFSTGLKSGSGVCGRLSRTEATTDDHGVATVTYRASAWNVSCWVVAVEAEGGRAAESVIYQGTTQKAIPTLDGSFPTLLKAGAPPAMFTLDVANPSGQPLAGARVDLAVLSGTPNSAAVDASQVHLSYSTTGPKGRFTPVDLGGSTGNGGVIEAYIGAKEGATMAPASTRTMTFRVALASNMPVSKTSPVMAFEAYLDQVNSASGSATTLADTHVTNVMVPGVAPTNTMMYVLIGVGVLVVVLLAIASGLLWRRRKKHRAEPAPEPAAAATP